MSTTTDRPTVPVPGQVPVDRATALARTAVLMIAVVVATSVLAALVLDAFGVRLQGPALATGPLLVAAAAILVRRRRRGGAGSSGSHGGEDGGEDAGERHEVAARSPLTVPLALVAAALVTGAVIVGVPGAGPVSEPVTVLALDPAGAQGAAVVVIQEGASAATFDVVFLGASGELGRRTVTVGGDEAVSVSVIVSTTEVHLVAAGGDVPLRSLRFTADG